MSKTNKLTLLPVMLCFFAMGFVDLVGIASNYVKNDLQLSDSTANVFPSLVFFWFLIFSVPTGMLMNKIGRKKTVLISLVVTLFSLLLPIFGESYGLMLVSFSLLGIGNALMQTSLNPLVSTVMKGGNLASTLTFGQFVKAIASFMAPYLAIWGAQASIPAFGLGWRVLFPIYLIVGTIATLLLFSTPIEEEPIEGKASSFAECFSLLGKPIVLLSTIGCLTGSFFLRVMNNKLFFIISVTMMALSMCGMAVGTSKTVLFVAIALVGYGNSNVFSMVFARALQSVPDKQNEVSGLMIMGLFGGTIFPLLMGFASDGFGQVGAVVVMAVGVLYLFSYIPKMNNK